MTSERDNKPTVAMSREVILGLIAQSITVDDEERNASPIAILFVIGLFAALFVAIVKLS